MTISLVTFGMQLVGHVTVTIEIPPYQEATKAGLTAEYSNYTSPPYDPHNYSYSILEKDVCRMRNNTDVYLVIVVIASPANFEQRNVIRNTWGSVVKIKPDVRLIFILGKTNNDTLQKQIAKESKTYQDIVQEDFIDSYRNLSIKSVAMLKWVFEYCKEAKYLLKADDDMYINVDFLISILKLRSPNNAVVGKLIHGARPIKNPNSKWYTPPEMYGEEVYPDYCSGTAYVVSADIVSKLFNASKNRTLFWLEDIFITGICRTAIKADIMNDWGFTYDKLRVDGCTFRKRVSGHQYTPEEIQQIWTEVNDHNLKC